MRLLTYDPHGELYITRDLADDDIPPYAILSHTWGDDDDEVRYHEIGSQTYKSKAGYRKIEFCGQQAQRDGLQHFWVDTCCIDKTNHVELSEAITSMYRWYQNAHACYVYLADVASMHDDSGGQSSLRSSRWFTRGWTLQELLAPKQVIFYSDQGECLGTKETLKNLLHEITSIPITALENQNLSQFSVAERLRWAENRKTKKKEDRAYCLLGIFGVYLPLIYGEGDHAFIRLTEAINKTPKIPVSLRVASDAAFNAYGQPHQGCHPATRIDLLQTIRKWARDPLGKSIFWLNGVAGTGKSTISWTVAKWLADLGTNDSLTLGASFFFKRGERASAALFFATTASQLATSVDNFDVFLAQAVKADPQISQKSLAEQFNRLICDPLRHLRSNAARTTYFVVVDALDECESESDVRAILRLWSTLPTIDTYRFRLFLTSRPELVIRLGFQRMSTDVHHDLILHEIPRPVIRHDILVFLTDALCNVRTEYNLLLGNDLADEGLAEDWPGSPTLQKLTDIAMPLFIVAATICRLVRGARDPQRSIQTILHSGRTTHLADVSLIYTLVLEAMASFEDAEDILQVYNDFRMIVGPIITLAQPLSRIALAALLQIKPVKVQVSLQPLHSVLEVPSDGDKMIRPLHLSFREYLTGPEARQTPYWIDSKVIHASLWRRCLQLLSHELRENICGLEYCGQPRSALPLTQVEESLRPEVQYACRYWIYHVKQSGCDPRNENEIDSFLTQHFLYWLEALSFMDQIFEAAGLIDTLRSCISITCHTSAFLEDARCFVLAYGYIIDLAPLQLYSSATIFAPENSLVRQTCGKVPAWIRHCPRTIEEWSSELPSLEGHGPSVSTVEFSPDGLLLASASADRTIRLWDVRNGRQVQTLVGDAAVSTMSFSPNSALLASGPGLLDHTIRLWDIQIGQVVHQFEGHLDSASSVSFSPDGLLLASASWDGTIRLWEVSTGRQILMLVVYVSQSRSVRFSPDGSLFAFASDDGIVSLRETHTGREIRKLGGHTALVSSVSFSPHGSILASASWDCTVRLWKISTGQTVSILERHTSPVTSVCFSPDGSLLVSASGDCSVRLWEVQTEREIQRFDGHMALVSAASFSPDGSSIASGSVDGSIKFWKVRTTQKGQMTQQTQTRQKSQEFHEYANRSRSLLLSPDSSLLVSALAGADIRLWNTHTKQEVLQMEASPRPFEALVFSPDGSLLLTASADDDIRMWNLEAKQEVQRLQKPKYSITHLVFSPDGLLLASASKDRTVQLWRVQTGRQIQSSQKHTSNIMSLCFSSDGLILASSSHNGAVELWDVPNRQDIYTFEGQKLSGYTLKFSPHGRLLAGAQDDYTIKLWDLPNGREVQKFDRSMSIVFLMSFSSDGSQLASASADSRIRLWDVSTGELKLVITDVPMIRTLKLNLEDGVLTTNVGTIQMTANRLLKQHDGLEDDDGRQNPAEMIENVSKDDEVAKVLVCDDWVCFEGRDLLWLPREYRGLDTIVCHNTVVFADRSGHVSFLEIDARASKQSASGKV